MDYEKDEEISEGAEYSPKSEFSKPKLCEEAVRKCIEVRSKEMKKGFWNTKLTKEGLPIKTWVEDTRQIFIGSVVALKSILSPEINLDKNCKKDMGDFEKNLKQAREDYSYEEQIIEMEGSNSIWKKSGKKYIPEIGAKVIIKDITRKNFAVQVIGGWDSKVNIYWDVIFQEYDKIFPRLNELINKLNYFKQKVSY